ncbi:MAG: hypothetical protein OXR73_01175 [Myxococcales bacterium]|nr:hypothetical protein [Myxococcales bacterium]
MEHVIEAATSRRAKCRGCGQRIDKGSLRFGEQVENPYNDGVTTLWFHPTCGAFKRPEPFLEAAEKMTEREGADTPDGFDALTAAAQRGLEHRRLARLDSAEAAASGRASCRHCRERIDKGALRIRLVWFEAGRFEPSGFLHLTCAAPYCGATDVLPRIRQFTTGLSDEAWAKVEQALAG